ncbi:MAG: hypothetical protein MI923_10205 [Phycisphaerales bacterium]|nr:hypothetical protein [Phycisphaerales bacterium]
MSPRSSVIGLVLSALIVHPISADESSQSAGPRGTSPDMTFCELFGLFQFGREGSVAGLAVGTTSWNIGNADLQWFESPASEHPFIVMNLYRLKDDRFEQIGQSWVKHGFFALDDTQCGGTCTFEPGHAFGPWLGMGCTDTYSPGLNGVQDGLGPRYEVNPWTGAWSHTGSHFDLGGPPHDGISHRLQVHDDDLDPVLNEGASYYVEGYYVILDDVNVMNSASWKPVNPQGAPGGLWTFEMTDRSVPPNIGFAVDAWSGASQAVFAQEIPPVEFVSPDGRCILTGKAIALSDQFWRYEYALLNIDMDRQVGSLTIPISAGALVRNVGFHAVRHHDEPVNEPGGALIDNGDWNESVGSVVCLSSGSGGRVVTWSTTSNPLRWGTAYSFRFEANVPPIPDASITIGHFKPGIPTHLTSSMLGPSLNPPDCDGNMIPDCQEIADMPSLDCDGNLILDACDANCDGIGPPDACVIADCPPGDVSCADCNENGIPDSCDLAVSSGDCNQNGIPDECEIDENGVAPGGPYFCESDCAADCNANGIPDECEIDENSPAPGGPFFCTANCALDCNENGLPDECEVPPIGVGDCNQNGVPDECDPDCDDDGLTDDCELPLCAGLLVGDMDCSGAVDLDDMPLFIDYLLAGTSSCSADLNHDLVVNGLDVPCFIDTVVSATPCP